MLRDDFIETDEWQAIVRTVRSWQEHAMASLRNAGDFATARYYAGYLDSMESLLDLPEKLLSNGEPPEGVRELPNHPRPTKTLF